MPQIKQLDRHVAELIAAGEVVERPASVMKELLENALDAGATAVSAEIEKGGLTYLRLTDDGCGIAPDQLPTAFLRHATSKVRTADDLSAIGTLGFRGEALAAISAVSHTDIFSREQGAQEGAQLTVNGGVAGEVRPAGCPEGTTICVRDLFYNTPARMKFMKKDSAEGAAVAGIFTHLALSRPDVSFRLVRDGKEVLHTPGDGKLHSAVYAALGREFAMSLLPARGADSDVTVEGLVTKPLAGAATRGKQIFFVNGRFVKSQLLTAALEEAYKNRLMKGKFPGCVLHIKLPAHLLDANVHPAKTVVKFADERTVFHAVYYTVMAALDGEGKAQAPAPPALPAQEGFRTMTAAEYKATAPKPAEKKPLGSYTVREYTPPQPAAPMTPASPAPRKQEALLPIHDVAPEPGKPFTAPAPGGKTYIITPPVPPEEKIAPVTENPTPMVEKAAPATEKIPVPAEEPVQETILPDGAPWRIVGEVLKTYIVCEDGSDVYLIDKHAAHERLRFDALKARQEPLMSQTLLSPLAVTLTPEGYDAALNDLEELSHFGFTCEDFGDGTLLVREIPADIDIASAADTLNELCDKMALGAADPAAARDTLLHTMACKSAIKAGMTSDETELAVLVEKVRAGQIRYCPHGRPVCQKMTRYDIEKMFKRA